MKKAIILGVALATVLGTVTSCDKVKEITNASANMKGVDIDYQMLSKPEEVNKWLGEVKTRAGENAKVMDEIEIYVTRPALEGSIKREGEKDQLNVRIIYQDPVDKRRVEQIDYSNEFGWDKPEKKEIQVMGVGAEEFRLEDELFDFNKISFQTINKVVQDAFAEHKDEEKYEYQYVKQIKITIEGIYVRIHGKLKANGVEKGESYKTDLQGNKEK